MGFVLFLFGVCLRVFFLFVCLLLQVLIFILQGIKKQTNVDRKDLAACWVSPCVIWDVALSAGVGWKQSAFLQLDGW